MASICMRRSSVFQRRAGILAAVLFAHAALATTGVPDGRSLYAGCVACHGKQGDGLAAVRAPAIAGLEAWYVERQLKNFATGLRGAAAGDAEGATMRAAAALLKNDVERAAVAAYVAGLAPRRAAQSAPSNAAALTNGRNYFNALCSACHGANGKGNQQLGAPRLAGASSDYLARQFAAFKSGRRGAHADDKLGTQMRAIAAMLPDSRTEQDVIVYAAGLPL
jgi:cytochrome c oxidase subunit 2